MEDDTIISVYFPRGWDWSRQRQWLDDHWPRFWWRSHELGGSFDICIAYAIHGSVAEYAREHNLPL